MNSLSHASTAGLCNYYITYVTYRVKVYMPAPFLVGITFSGGAYSFLEIFMSRKPGELERVWALALGSSVGSNPSLLVASCVILGECIHFPGSLFPHLENGGRTTL